MSEVSNILVIDDEQIICYGIKQTLQQEGITIDCAENGFIGLAKVQDKKYDVVLIDLMMPQMSGMEVLEAIRKIDPTIVAIIITGYATIESAVEAVHKGAYDYIPKPFTPDELRRVVRKGLERHQLLFETDKLRKEREQHLLEIASEKSRLITIINCMGEGLIATDASANLLLINPVACKLLNIEQPAEIGRTIQGYLNNTELENLIIENLEKKKFPKKYFSKEIVFNETEGVIYLATFAPIKEKKDEISGIALVLMDISEEKKLDKMKAEFNKLVALVTHELKAPINAIEGYIDLILNGYLIDQPDKQVEYLTRSRDKAETLRNLVHDLLSLTSIESGRLTRQLEPVDIRLVLKEISNFMENEAQLKQITIHLEIPDELPFVKGDKSTLTHLFTNLMSNAIKYNHTGGSITIRASVENNYLITSVIDTGFGISEEDQRHLFEEFYRSKNKEMKKISGTGLGLNITKRITELHDGFIKVKSKLGKGSQFDVYLPV